MSDNLDINLIMENQPIMNILTGGAVAHGKSTLVKNISGVSTQRYSSEKQKNLTIKLGYANAKIYCCYKCEAPMCYQAFPSNTKSAKCKLCNNNMILKRHISFVDCPGHNMLMATMLNGTCVADNMILIESTDNSSIPAIQTKEHLLASEIINLTCDIVCLNKMDLVKKTVGDKKLKQFEDWIKTTSLKDSLIVPLSANFGYNIDVILQYICNINIPARRLDVPIKMYVIRSFNINHQDSKIENMKGGVVGGTILEGILKINDKVVILPGLINKTNNKKIRWSYTPIYTKVESLKSDNNHLELAIPGGLIGVQLTIDPSLTIRDNLIGSILTSKKRIDKFKIVEKIMVRYELLKDDIIEKNNIIFINYNASNVMCTVSKVSDTKLVLKLEEKPICIEPGDTVTLSIKNPTLRILGRGIIVNGLECKKI